MAVLTSANAQPVYQSGQADLIALLALRHVTSGDTLDVTTVTNPAFQVVQRGVVLGISEFAEIAATFTGTTVTMPAGLSNDSAYLLIWGC